MLELGMNPETMIAAIRDLPAWERDRAQAAQQQMLRAELQVGLDALARGEARDAHDVITALRARA